MRVLSLRSNLKTGIASSAPHPRNDIFYLFLLSFFFFMSSFSPLSLGASTSSTPEAVAKQIENRRISWVALKARVVLHFYQEDREKASCFGRLLYERLQEKVVLSCVGRQNKLLFVFKTLDRSFELYLPALKTVYEGNIFALSDSPEIDSHLKPLDLYRALKPMTFAAAESEIEKQDETHTAVKIYSERHNKRYLARKILATREGDVPVEIYYSENEEPETLIQRSDYQEILLPGQRSKGKVVFPRQIQIDSSAKRNKTVLLFKKIEFPARFVDENWGISYPEDVQRAAVEDPALKRQIEFEKAPAT
ncbi:MAG: hypothetical protein HYZ84_07215 [Candidatus Omnitrophica bacterium]|nr:hypothetical protein [Candidatus Omnitrophota bacterium]